MTTSCGLLVRLSAKSGKSEKVEDFMLSALPLVNQEPGTTAWFAIKFGRADYGLLEFFPSEADRDAHLNSPAIKAMRERADALLDDPPQIQNLTVLAEKLPLTAPGEPVAKAVLLTFKPHEGHERQVEQFLRGAEAFVRDEEKTVAWFAFQLDDGQYGIFDVFPDNAGRFAHLIGRVPLELTKHALSLLGGFPDMDLPNVLASKLG
jgi:quinol monooxygenase YgiN